MKKKKIISIFLIIIKGSKREEYNRKVMEVEKIEKNLIKIEEINKVNII